MTEPQSPPSTIPILIGWALLPVIFVADLEIPLGYAGGMPYVVPILLGLWASRRSYVWAIAAAATALTVIGFVASARTGEPSWTVYLNRIAAIGGQWIAAIVVLHQNRTRDALRATEKEVSRQNQERKALIEQLEATNAELEQFTYTVSHDLKSPLVTIKGFVGLLEKDAAAGDEQRLRGDIERIAKAADKMSQLLDELLELSRIGRVANPPEDISLSALARETVDLLAGRIEQAGATVEIEPNLPVVRGDRVRLQQVLQNLIENAIKFTGNQSEPRIEIGMRHNGTAPAFFVRDNGAGIEPQYRDKVFGLFERLDPHQPGNGVGLALARRIVEVHDGRLWVESEGRDRGSCFLFTLAETE